MSVRLQVVLEEREMRDLRRVAKQNGVTVSEWVRQALRKVRRQEPEHDQGRKLAAVRCGAKHAFPAPDIGDMLAEIERGYPTGLPE
jgi:hypothetical protein